MAADRNLIESSAEVRRALREELLDLLHSKNIRSVYQHRLLERRGGPRLRGFNARTGTECASFPAAVV